MSETKRIADQLRRAFAGDPWHGDPLSAILAGVTADQAQARPLPKSHNIWEIVLHIELYTGLAIGAIQGIPMPRLYVEKKDWPPVTGEWATALEKLFATAESLAQAIDAFPDTRLEDTVPGRDYNFYYLFHGIVQHSLYHGGQISLLKGNL